jgi:tetratricopeptide (TPR) repeat protein
MDSAVVGADRRRNPECGKASRKALELAPGDAWLHKQAADCYGAEHLRSSLDLDPLNPYTLGVYGSTLIEHGKAEEGLQYLRWAVQLDPQNFIIHFRLGAHLTQSHHYQEAVAEFSAAEAISPDSLTSEVGLAWAEGSPGRLDDDLTKPAAIIERLTEIAKREEGHKAALFLLEHERLDLQLRLYGTDWKQPPAPASGDARDPPL